MFRMERALLRRILRAARTEQVTPSELIRRAVREYVETVELRETEQ
jgi:metal-responsive CopG/Arc/MetJ family transcriptional regulator